MKKLMILAVLAASAALPATATADRVHNVVSIHADNYFCCTDQIYGSVESGKPKCERNRTIKLFHEPADNNKRGDGFQHMATTTTNSKGEYRFEEGNVDNKLVPSSDFPPGDYFARATRAVRGNDVCIRDDSRVITLEGFIVCTSKQASEETAARQNGPTC
jgi:hypothetical protein